MLPAMRERLSGMSIRQVCGLVLAVHVAWLGAFFALGHEPLDAVRLGASHIGPPNASPAIAEAVFGREDGGRGVVRPSGYDGQYAYFIAVDPTGARPHLDIAGYRYSRPLYPFLGRALSGGSADLIPWAFLLINLAAAVGGAYAVARFLVRHHLPAALALVYGLSPGLLVSFQRDLTEPLAHALAALAVLLFSTRSTGRWVGAAVVLALAGLTRQTTLVFALPLALLLVAPAATTAAGVVRRITAAGLARAAAFLAIAGLPYTILLVTLHHEYGSTSGDGNFTTIPLSGVLAHEFQLHRHGVSILTVVIPVLIWMVLAVGRLRRAGSTPPTVPLAMALAAVISALLLVVFNVDSNTFTARGRSAVGVTLAAVLAAPALLAGSRSTRWWGAAAILWLSMLPVVWATGFDPEGVT